MDNTNTTQQLLGKFMGSMFQRRNAWLGIILLTALLGFEAFNYSTTFTALNDLLGDMRFAGVRWATILALAFSSIDFAGIARMFSDDKEESAGREIWFLFVAWLLAATMNATLTWWGVSLALVNHSMSSTSLVDPNVLMRAVPIFVAIMVWVTRILLISSISSAGSRFMGTDVDAGDQPNRAIVPTQYAAARPRPVQNTAPAARPSTQRGTQSNNQPGQLPASTQQFAAPRSTNGSSSSRPQGDRQSTSPAPRPQNDRPQSTGAPNRPQADRPSNPAPAPRPTADRPAASAPVQPKPQSSRPPVNRSPRTQPPMPPPPPVEDDFEIEEPEYIPDPNYIPSQSAFHSLSARSKGNSTPRQS